MIIIITMVTVTTEHNYHKIAFKSSTLRRATTEKNQIKSKQSAVAMWMNEVAMNDELKIFVFSAFVSAQKLWFQWIDNGSSGHRIRFSNKKNIFFFLLTRYNSNTLQLFMFL